MNQKPTWIATFFIDALLWAQRSPDVHTKCGAVIVRNNIVISSGYNGFIRGAYTDNFPLDRPQKYNFFIHAEHNAILNCARNGFSTLGSDIYITGEPCNNCLQYIWQAGIRTIYYTDFSIPHSLQNESHKEVRDKLKQAMGLPIIFIPQKELNCERIVECLKNKM